MALKVSNETKVGALTAISITLLILGFNFLKGRSYSGKTFIYAKFKDIDGLLVSNAVTINGFQVGTVVDITEADPNLTDILVKLKLVKDIHIPNTSFAIIKSNPLGTTTIEVKFDSAKPATFYLKTGDTLKTGLSESLFGDVGSKIDPIINQLKGNLTSLDNVLQNVNSIFDPGLKGNLHSIIANANNATARIVASTASLQQLLNTNTGALAKSLNNMEVFSKTLADSKDQVNGIMTNVQKTTETLSKMELDKTIRQMNDAMGELKSTIEKINSTDGTVGALINDKKIYNNLSSTINSLNLLLQDLRLHPKRYVNVSVFGKKDRSTPLMRPMQEDSITQEQKILHQ